MQSYADVMQSMAIAVAQASRKIAIDFTHASTVINDKATKSGLPDFVTATDIEAQSIIETTLKQRYPDIEFIGEEGPAKSSRPSAYFLVDPIDGTSNFVALRDYFACCAAYVEDNQVKAAVIADPMRGFLVKAYEGGGCFKTTLDMPENNQVIPPLSNEETSLKQIQLECELAMNQPQHFTILSKLVPQMSGMRKSGSTALDMANLALGRKIALISGGLEPHDLAPGLLIVREAGGIVTDFNGTDASIASDTILAASRPIHKKMLENLSM